WLTTQNHSTLVTERSAVPFLPVNPEYSATRNQGRQKLARFNAREFATLLIDILGEAKRRQQGKSLLSPTDALDYSLRSQSDLDDQHDYDSVASDEDTDQELLRNASRNNRARSMDSSDLSDGPITLQEYLEVKKALAASEAKVQQLMKVDNSLMCWGGREVEDEALYSMHIPASVYRMRKGPSASSVPFPPSSPLLSCPPDSARHMSKLDRHGSGTDSDYDNTQTGEVLISMEGKRFVELSKDEDFPHELDPLDGELDPGLPSTEDVILKTEQVTKNIQELLRAAQESKHDSAAVTATEVSAGCLLLPWYPAGCGDTPLASLERGWDRTPKPTRGTEVCGGGVKASRSLRELEEALFCQTRSHPTSWDSYWERNEPLREADEAAVPVLCLCSTDDPVRGPPVPSLPLELFPPSPYFFLLLTPRGGHCGFPRCGSGHCWGHEAVLEYFRATGEFLGAEERRKGLLRPRRCGGPIVEPPVFTWQRSYTR
ncbi:PREDICTED: ARF GTPase-activating protein GIT1-like, partial [Chaetura pelagica]|uniref:ARF GTPase-activating protein GIT1-like n=1 Tax=Chaetura pelagica TaxID=8897 RepID=UPI0005231B51